MFVDASDIMASNNVTVITVDENNDKLIGLQEFQKNVIILFLTLSHQTFMYRKSVKYCF